jgi:hypothetical protein
MRNVDKIAQTMMEARQAQNITAHNAGDVTITFDTIDVMPHIDIDPVTRRTD